MGKRPTPDPEARDLTFSLGCVLLVVLPALAVLLAARFEWWGWALLLCLPGLAVAAYWVYWKALLLCAILAYKPRGIAGVLVTSDSPNWNAYVRENWLERFGDRFIVLNWSQRKQWRKTLTTLLFSCFCSSQNFCPSVIFLRGLRHPLMFRFFYAFRDYKHGNEEALRRLEDRLLQELGLERRPD